MTSNTTLPVQADLQAYYPVSFEPDVFTKEERFLLNPFFTNLDKPVFVLQNLPTEIAAALASRYSRSMWGLRRVFLKEYIWPLVHPELLPGWESLDIASRKSSLETKDEVLGFITYLNEHGGLEHVADIQRARKFFEKWLNQYGDDSIAELGSYLVGIEGVSMLCSIWGVESIPYASLIAKSTRYVNFSDKRTDGEYKFIIPGEIRGTKYEESYTKALHNLFATYANTISPYTEYVKGIYPKGDDESDTSFHASRQAKAFDDLRELLPFATQTSFAIHANMRSFEAIINNLLAQPFGEARWLGQAIFEELHTVAPSLISRVNTPRGAAVQQYRAQMITYKGKLGKKVKTNNGVLEKERIRLLDYTKDAEKKILSAYLFHEGTSGYDEITQSINKLSAEERKKMLKELLKLRSNGGSNMPREAIRFNTVEDAFKHAHYSFLLLIRGGDLRDLYRHRYADKAISCMNLRNGYTLENEVIKSPFIKQISQALEGVKKVYDDLEKKDPSISQYVVPFGYRQELYLQLSAWEVYWIGELRTGTQARPEYGEICRQMASIAKRVDPNIFSAMIIGEEEGRIPRRKYAKKLEEKAKE